MIYLYCFYGLTFYTLASAMFLQSFSEIRIIPARSAFFLAAFGFLHGSFKFFKMLQMIEMKGVVNLIPGWLSVTGAMLLPASYLCLLLFGIEDLIARKKWRKESRYSYLFVPLFTVFFSYYYLGARYLTPDLWLNWSELLTRYFLAIPATWVAAFTFFSIAGEFKRSQDTRLRRILESCAAIFILIGFATSLLQFSKQEFEMNHRLLFTPIVVLIRAGLVLILTILLSDAFIVEISKINRKLKKMKEEFTSMMAHDLRNIAWRIEASSEILINHSTTLREERDQELLRILNFSSKTLFQYLSDMFDSNLIELAKIELNKKRIDLRDLVSTTYNELMAQNPNRKFKLVLPENPVMVLIDTDRIKQVLSNLLSNALKYSFANSSIEINLRKFRSTVEFSVSDYGEVIPPKELDQLFTKFYRTEASKRSAKGTGLGLFIVKNLIEAHGGDVFASCDSSGKTLIGFSIPIQYVEAERGFAQANFSHFNL